MRPGDYHDDAGVQDPISKSAMVDLYQKARPTIKTGDIVLFSGRGFISWGIEKFTKSPWSHIGMVIKDDVWDIVHLWESTTLANVDDADAGKCVSGCMTTNLSSRVLDFKGKVVLRPILVPFTDADISLLAQMRKTFIGKPYEKNKLVLLRAALGWIGHSEDLTSIFCSELVAEALQVIGRDTKGPPADSYIPSDFASTGSRFPEMAVQFGPDVVLREG